MLSRMYLELLEAMPGPRARYVVSLSSGVSSAIAADRALKRWGHDVVDLVFMDTRWEDEDNYRFLRDLEAYWQHPIVRLTDGRTPLEVAEEEHIIPNQKIAPCTHRLKIELFMFYLEALKREHDVITVILGMNWSEQHRMASPRRNYASRGYLVDYPLLWKPYVLRPFDEVRSWGIEPPRMYALGYTHANCGGRCVKQGQGDWLRTLREWPDRFEDVATWEREMRRDARFANYALLRDFTGGEMTPMTLDELRRRHKNNGGQIEMFQANSFEDNTNCYCNAGDPGALPRRE